MDQLLNIKEKQPFLKPLALGKLLTTKYGVLPLRVISPIATIHKAPRFKGYYINPDNSIDIYGDDKVGISLNQFWRNLVIYDIYDRPRIFLQKSEDGKYRPRVSLKAKRNPNDNLIIMPVAVEDIRPGDIRFVSADDSYQVMVTHVENKVDTIVIHLINAFGEPETETYNIDDLTDYDDMDWFYTIIRL